MLTRAEISKRYRQRYPARAKAAREAWKLKNPTYHRDYERRYRRFRRSTGIKKDAFLQLMYKQEGKCGICKVQLDEGLVVDHNHQTNEVRGLLCRQCNTGIGQLQDSVLLLETAIEYLKS